VMDYLPSMPGAMLFFIFMNKSIAGAMRTTAVENKADYVNTGRPHANKSYTLLDAFKACRRSHYNPGTALLSIWLVYYFNNTESGFLPMYMILIMAFVWILCPVLFQPPNPISMGDQLSQLWSFISPAPKRWNRKDPKNPKSLAEAVLQDELASSRERPVELFLWSLIPSWVLLFIMPAVAYDQLPPPLFAMSYYFVVHYIWGTVSQQEYSTFVLWSVLMVSVIVVILFGSSDWGMTFIAMYALYRWELTVKYGLWTWLKVRCCRGNSGVDSDAQVTLLYHSLPTFPWHFASAFCVLFLQALLAGLLWLLDRAKVPLLGRPLGLQTMCLLGKNFKQDNVETIWPQQSEESDANDDHESHGQTANTLRYRVNSFRWDRSRNNLFLDIDQSRPPVRAGP